MFVCVVCVVVCSNCVDCWWCLLSCWCVVICFFSVVIWLCNLVVCLVWGVRVCNLLVNSILVFFSEVVCEVMC